MIWPWRRADNPLARVRLDEEEARLRQKRDTLIDAVARQIVQRGLETPAVFFLEMNRPLTFIAGQTALVAAPFLTPIVHPRDVEDLARIMEDRANVDRLIARIEDLVEARGKQRAAAKAG